MSAVDGHRANAPERNDPRRPGERSDCPGRVQLCPAAFRPSVRRIRLLDADPELGAGLSPAEFEVAQRYLVADLAELRRGTHQPWGIGSPDLLGLFVVDGVIIRTVQVANAAAASSWGPGRSCDRGITLATTHRSRSRSAGE